MIPENIKKQIITIWESYISSDRVVQDVKGNILYELDEDRLKAIEEIKKIIEDFF
jgi:hypothetical protein